MSGLAAILYRDGRATNPGPLRKVQAMLDASPHRGVDGTWVRQAGPVTLGYAKLAITPEEENEQQPLLSPRTGCLLIADVRLDNRDDLLARLPGLLPLDHASVSDGDLILAAYDAWGVEALPRLLGDFALVLWDPRQQRLLCARDTSGQRPLFYRMDRQEFAAASEIQQLFQDSAVPVEPNEEHVRQFLVPANIFVNEKGGATTFYEGVHSLPAGHLLLVETEQLQIRPFWQLEPPAELRYRNEADYADHFRELLFETVQARLRSSRPVGIMLSGGLDSSSVACAAQEVYRTGRAQDHGFTSFSLVFDGLDCDERELVEDVQAKYGFRAEYLPVPDLTGELQLEPVGFLDSPMARPNAGEAIFEAACRAGVRTLLTGDVADGCVRGSPLVFDSLLRHGRLRSLWRRLKAYQRISGESRRKIAALYCLAPLLPLSWQKQVMQAHTNRDFRRNQRRLLPSWMPEAIRQDLAERHLQISLTQERQRRFSSPAREMEYRFLYPPEIARHPVGWPVEIWRPYADRRLHEFLLAVPPEIKFAPHPRTDALYAGSKRLLRQSLRGILPDSIRTRTGQTHFAAVFADQLAHQWPAYESAFGPSASPEIARRGYIDRELFWDRLLQMRGGRLTQDLIYVMRVVALETWLRTFQLPRTQRTTLPKRMAVASTRKVNL
jgi:asparagine synthase (glutamine-hydrolysing)